MANEQEGQNQTLQERIEAQNGLKVLDLSDEWRAVFRVNRLEREFPAPGEQIANNSSFVVVAAEPILRRYIEMRAATESFPVPYSWEEIGGSQAYVPSKEGEERIRVGKLVYYGYSPLSTHPLEKSIGVDKIILERAKPKPSN